MNQAALPTQSLTGQEYLPAHYYLRIYRLKLAMAEDGTTPHNPEWETFMRRLVGALTLLDPKTPIRLESTDGIARFSTANSGALLGEFRLSDAVSDTYD